MINRYHREINLPLSSGPVFKSSKRISSDTLLKIFASSSCSPLSPHSLFRLGPSFQSLINTWLHPSLLFASISDVINTAAATQQTIKPASRRREANFILKQNRFHSLAPSYPHTHKHLEMCVQVFCAKFGCQDS